MKKRKIILPLCLVAAIFLLAIALGYTYSKYTSSSKIKGLTSTATWSFDGSISNSSNMKTKQINLADTVSKSTIKTGKIAPGTSGDFKIVIDASGSEVDVDYDVVFENEEGKKPTNLYFTCEDLTNSRDSQGLIKYYSLSEMLKVDGSNQRSNMSGTILKSENSSPKVINVHWEWPYETRKDGVLQDDVDTKDSSIENYSFSINIIGKQAK